METFKERTQRHSKELKEKEFFTANFYVFDAI